MFLDSGMCFWILGRVLGSKKCFWILESVLSLRATVVLFQVRYQHRGRIFDHIILFPVGSTGDSSTDSRGQGEQT